MDFRELNKTQKHS